MVLCCVASGRVGTSLSLCVLKACSPARGSWRNEPRRQVPGRGAWNTPAGSRALQSLLNSEVELDPSPTGISTSSTSLPVGGRLSLGYV